MSDPKRTQKNHPPGHSDDPPVLHSAFSAEYLVLCGPDGAETMARAGSELLSHAYECVNFHQWPSPRDEGRAIVRTTAEHLHQLAYWLENREYSEQLTGREQHEAAYLYFLATAAAPVLHAVGEALRDGLDVHDITLPLPENPPRRPAPVDGPTNRLLLWEAATDLQAAGRHLQLAGEGVGKADFEAARLVALERRFHETVLPTAHDLTLAASEADPAASDDPAKLLQRHAATLAACLRYWVRSFQRLGSDLGAALGSPDRRKLTDRTRPFPVSLWARIEGLLAETLSGLIADLDSLAALGPDEPDTPPRTAAEVWAELRNPEEEDL